MPQPTEHDVMVVQEKLADLYASLTPVQQEVLDTIMAAGLSIVDDDDLSGYLLADDPTILQIHARSRIAELREEWNRTNPPPDAADDSSRLRWDLSPLLSWFRRQEAEPA
ncbi:MAG: hypothetical protein ACRDJE_15510 [Dehalococcoidia bacterium]